LQGHAGHARRMLPGPCADRVAVVVECRSGHGKCGGNSVHNWGDQAAPGC